MLRGSRLNSLDDSDRVSGSPSIVSYRSGCSRVSFSGAASSRVSSRSHGQRPQLEHVTFESDREEIYRMIEDDKYSDHEELVATFVAVGEKAYRQARKAFSQAERGELYAKQAFLQVSSHSNAMQLNCSRPKSWELLKHVVIVTKSLFPCCRTRRIFCGRCPSLGCKSRHRSF